MWQALTQDVSTVCKEIIEKQVPEKQTYMSLPRPGVSRSMFRLNQCDVLMLFIFKPFLII